MGIYNLNDRKANQSLLNKMTDIIKHRGPNDRGIYIDNEVGLGHRRFST